MEDLKQANFCKFKVNTILNGMTAFYFFYSFFEPYFNQIIGPIMKYYILFLVALYIFHFKGKMGLNNITISVLGWFLFSCITLLWARDFTIVKMHFLTVSGAVALLICLLQFPVDKKLIDYSIFTFWFGSSIVGLLSLFFHSGYYHYGKVFSVRQVLTISGVQTDPNDQSIFLLFGISIALFYIFVKRKYVILSVITVVINSISIMMTASRGGFLSLGLLLLITILFVVRDWKTKLWMILASLVVAVLIVRLLPSFLSASSLERIIQFDTYEGGGNRITFWKSGFRLLNENPFYYLFGAGWGSYYNYDETHGMHNTYLELFFNTGLVGFLLFFYPVFRCNVYMWKHKKYLPIFVSIAILLPAFFLDCINKRFFWNAIYFLYMSYYFENNNNDVDTCVEINVDDNNDSGYRTDIDSNIDI